MVIASETERRNFLVSAVIPYVYVLSIGLAIVLVSFITTALEILENRQLMLFGWSLSLELTFRVVLYIVGVVGEVLMLTSLYLFMPAVRVRFLHALIGGITATILWEITRRGLIWYYSTLSMVNLIYGSFATPVVALLTAEAIALIVLLGAQVIAELEDNDRLKAGGLSAFLYALPREGCRCHAVRRPSRNRLSVEAVREATES